MTILLVALYGHPDSVTMWVLLCDLAVKSVGFSAVGAEWPSVYYHKELELLLIIYVDDFKLAGPEENLAKGWALLRTKLTIGPEGPLGMYLGCNQQRESMTLYDGGTANIVIYDMESFLMQCIERYLQVAPAGTKLKSASTPFLHDEGILGRPGTLLPKLVKHVYGATTLHPRRCHRVRYHKLGEILDHPSMLLQRSPDSLKWMMIVGNLRIPHQVYS